MNEDTPKVKASYDRPMLGLLIVMLVLLSPVILILLLFYGLTWCIGWAGEKVGEWLS